MMLATALILGVTAVSPLWGQSVGPSSVSTYSSIEYNSWVARRTYCCWNWNRFRREVGASAWSYETNLSPSNPNEFLLTFSARMNWHDFEIILSQTKEGPQSGEVYYTVLHGSSHGISSRIRYGRQAYQDANNNTVFVYRDSATVDYFWTGRTYTTHLEFTNYWVYYKEKRIVFGHGKVPNPKALDYLFDATRPKPTLAEGLILEWRDSITSGSVPIRGFGFGCNYNKVFFRDIKLLSDPSILRAVSSFRYRPPATPMPAKLPFDRFSFQSVPRFHPNPHLFVIKFAVATNAEFHVLLSSTYGTFDASTYGFEIRGNLPGNKIALYRVIEEEAILLSEGTLSFSIGEYWLAYNNDKQIIAVGAGAAPEVANIPYLAYGNTNYPLQGNVFNATFPVFMTTPIADVALAGGAAEVLYQAIQYLPNPDEIHPTPSFLLPNWAGTNTINGVGENTPYTIGSTDIKISNMPSFVRPQDVTIRVLHSWNGNNFTVFRDGNWVNVANPWFTLDDINKGFVRWTSQKDWARQWAQFMVAWRFPHTKFQTGRLGWYVNNVDTAPYLRTALADPLMQMTADGALTRTMSSIMLPGTDNDNPNNELFYAFSSSNLPGKFRFAREVDSSLSCITAAVGKGRYVTIYFEDTPGNHLNLGDIQVLAPNGTNVALQKSVTASSIWNAANRPHSLFVDGITSTFGHLGNAPFGSNNWITVDLGDDTDISSIVVYNRANCCRDRILGAFIKVTTSSGNRVFNSFFPKGERVLYKFPLCVVWEDAAISSNAETLLGNQNGRFDQADVHSGQVEFVPNPGIIPVGTYSATFKLCAINSVTRTGAVCSPDYTLNVVIVPGGNQPPVLRTQSAYSLEGERVLLSSYNLLVTDNDTLSTDLVFLPTIDVNLGSIEVRRNQSITTNAQSFTYEDVLNNFVYFVPGPVRSTGASNPVKIDIELQDKALSTTLTLTSSVYVYARKVDPIVQKLNLNKISWLQDNRLGYVVKNADLRYGYAAGDESDVVYRLENIEPANMVRMQLLTTTWVDLNPGTTFTQLDIWNERVRLVAFDEKVHGISNVTLSVGSQLTFDSLQADQTQQQLETNSTTGTNSTTEVLEESELEKTIRLLDEPLIQNGSLVNAQLEVAIIKTYSAPNCIVAFPTDDNAQLQTSPFLLDKTILYAFHPDFDPSNIFIRVRDLPASELAVFQTRMANTTDWSPIGVNAIFTQADLLDGNIQITPDKSYHGWSYEITVGMDVFIRNPLQNNREEITAVILKIRIIHPNEAPMVGAVQSLNTEYNSPRVFKSEDIEVSDTEHSADELNWYVIGTEKGVLQVKPTNDDWKEFNELTGTEFNVTHAMVQNGFVRFVPVDQTVGWTSAKVKVCDPQGACSEEFSINIDVKEKSSQSTLYAAIGGSTAALVLIGGVGMAAYMRSIKKQGSHAMELVATNQQKAGFDIQLMLRMFAEGFVNMKKQLTRIENVQTQHSNMLLPGTNQPQGLLMGPEGVPLTQQQIQQLYTTSMTRSQQMLQQPFGTMTGSRQSLSLPGGMFSSMGRLSTNSLNRNGPYGTTPVTDLTSEIRDLDEITNVLYGFQQENTNLYATAQFNNPSANVMNEPEQQGGMNGTYYGGYDTSEQPYSDQTTFNNNV